MTRTALVRCYDNAYKPIADLSAASCANFCKSTNIESREWVASTLGPQPHRAKTKILAINQCFQAGIDRVIYVDVDVLFHPRFTAQQAQPLPPELTTGDFVLSQDSLGLCCGFFTIANTPLTRQLLRVWRDLGCLDTPGKRIIGDQDTLKLLVKHFPWVHDLVSLLPTTFVSCPEQVTRGQLAHHFWSNGGPGYWQKMTNPTGWPLV